MAVITRTQRRTFHTTVRSAEWLTPEWSASSSAATGLDGFGVGPFTDHYVKLQLPPPGAAYAAPFDAEEVKARLPREQWPRTRTYTVRAWDAAARQLTIDFVDHGDDGVAGPWAAAAEPGDLLQLSGPGGAYAPDPDAAWHLHGRRRERDPGDRRLARARPGGVPVHVLVEVDGPTTSRRWTRPATCS